MKETIIIGIAAISYLALSTNLAAITPAEKTAANVLKAAKGAFQPQQYVEFLKQYADPDNSKAVASFFKTLKMATPDEVKSFVEEDGLKQILHTIQYQGKATSAGERATKMRDMVREKIIDLVKSIVGPDRAGQWLADHDLL